MRSDAARVETGATFVRASLVRAGGVRASGVRASGACAFGAVGLVVALLAASARLHAQVGGTPASMPPPTRAPVPAGSLYALPMRFTAQDGTLLDVAELRGRPVVMAMVYLSCTMTCPVITSELQAVQGKLPPLTRARTTFVLASFDPARDSAPVAQAFAARMGLDPHWRVLTGSPASVRRLAVLLGVSYRRLPSGDFDHSNQVTVLDVDGVPRHQEVRMPPDRARLVRAIVDVAVP